MLTLIDIAIVTKCCGKNKVTINYAQNNNIYSLEKEVKIARSTVEQNPERRKDTYYPEPAISKEAQDEIKKILWNERMKAETKKDAERMSH